MILDVETASIASAGTLVTSRLEVPRILLRLTYVSLCLSLGLLIFALVNVTIDTNTASIHTGNFVAYVFTLAYNMATLSSTRQQFVYPDTPPPYTPLGPKSLVFVGILAFFWLICFGLDIMLMVLTYTTEFILVMPAVLAFAEASTLIAIMMVGLKARKEYQNSGESMGVDLEGGPK